MRSPHYRWFNPQKGSVKISDRRIVSILFGSCAKDFANFKTRRGSLGFSGRKRGEGSFLLAAGDTHESRSTYQGLFLSSLHMLPFQISLLVFLRITALSLASPVLLADVSSVEQSPSISSLSPNDDSIPSSSTTDLILSSKNNLASNPNDITPGLLTTAGDSSSWVDITSSPQQQQQQPQPIAFCGGAPNRKRAKVGQLAQLNGVGGETKVCDASLDYTAPSKDGGSTTQKEPTGQQTDTTGRKKKGSGEFYKGGGPRPGPTQIFPSDQDVELQNGMQAAKNRQLELDDPARCNYAPFFVRICCNGELGPRIFDSFRGFHYQFVGFCVLREFFSLFLLLRFPIPLPPPPPACPCL